MENTERAAIKPSRLLTAAIMALFWLFAGCGPAHRSFELVDKKHIVKPGSLAVLSGTKNKLDTILAEAITKELQRQGIFKVMSQHDVAEKLPNYPYSFIQAAAEDAREEYCADKTLVEIAQKRLQTTYLFVVWTENLTKRTKMTYGIPFQTTFSAYVIGNFFEYPGGGLTATAFYWHQRGQSIINAETESYAIESMTEEAGKGMAVYFHDAVKAK